MSCNRSVPTYTCLPLGSEYSDFKLVGDQGPQFHFEPLSKSREKCAAASQKNVGVKEGLEVPLNRADGVNDAVSKSRLVDTCQVKGWTTLRASTI
jgi:hypothetical protein